MTTTPPVGTTNTANTTGASSGSGSGGLSASIGADYNNFLTLLTTQLKHQDPLSPMDTTQFVQQLVQFSQVEQSITTNKKLDSLISLSGNNQAVGALGYIGKTIESNGDTGTLADGSARFTYTLGTEAK